MALAEVSEQAGVDRLPAEEPASQQTLTDLTRQAFAELRAALVTLG